MEAGCAEIGIGKVFEGAAIGCEGQGQGLANVTITDADVAQGIVQARSDRAGGARTAETGRVVDCISSELVGIGDRFTTAILELQLNLSRTTGCGRECGPCYGCVDLSCRATELNALSGVVGVSQAADAAIHRLKGQRQCVAV